MKLHPAIVVECLRNESHFREHQGADPTVVRDHDVAENHGKEDQISNPVIFQVLYYFFHDCLSSDAWDRVEAGDAFFSRFPFYSLKGSLLYPACHILINGANQFCTTFQNLRIFKHGIPIASLFVRNSFVVNNFTGALSEDNDSRRKK